jgi:hypothetical protein
MNRIVAKGMIFSLFVAGAACKSQPARPPQVVAPAPAPVVPEVPVPAVMPPAPPPPVGMADPFVRMNAAGVQLVDEGWKALRLRQYGQARAAFHAVVAAYPDKPAARFQELRAAVLENDFEAVPGLWRELLARDFIGYARRLDSGKEMAPLRASPQWKQIQEITTDMRARYSGGLERGVMFVARTHLGEVPELTAEGGETRVSLNQEAYHFDPISRRIRRLSDSGGQVVAIHPDTDLRQVILLAARTVRKVGGGVAFTRPEATVLSLRSLERVGPFAIDGDVMSVDLCFSDQGEPVWGVTTAGAADARPLTVDATLSGLVPLQGGCTDTVATTSVDPMGVEHYRPDPDGVALSEDGLQLTGIDGDRPVRAREVIRPGSFSWSPGRKRFVYTGSVDPCAPAPNGLFVWEGGSKKAVRLGSAVASYESVWVDDDHLAYETGMGRTPKVTIHDFAAGAPFTLKTPAGAGLFGVATLVCPGPEVALGL